MQSNSIKFTNNGEVTAVLSVVERKRPLRKGGGSSAESDAGGKDAGGGVGQRPGTATGANTNPSSTTLAYLDKYGHALDMDVDWDADLRESEVGMSAASRSRVPFAPGL